MKIRSLAIIAAAFIVTAVATPSFAMYHAGMGRFMQRDPHGTMNSPTAPRVGMADPAAGGGFVARDPMPTQPQPGLQYADGMNLYQYVRSQPIRYVDPSGLACNVIVKRVEADLKASAGNKRYGHEWIVIGSTKSYGWWPKDHVSGNAILDAIFGVEGEINRGRPTDPYHSYTLKVGDMTWETKKNTHWLIFDKKIEAGTSKGTKCKCATCKDITDCLDSFAGNYAGKWSLLRSCRTFSKEALDACCLKKGKKTVVKKSFTGGP